MGRTTKLLIGALLVPALLLGVVGLTTHLLTKQRRGEVADEARRLAAQVAGRAKDAFATQREGYELMVQNGAASPPLIAAVAGRVDARTLADLFASEPWWSPYRREGTVGISYEGTQLVFSEGSISALPAAPLIERARARRGPVSEVASVGDKLHFLAASPIHAPRRAAPGVLIFARALEGELLDVWAGRVKGGALVTDGLAVLAETGSAEERAFLKRGIGRERVGVIDRSDTAWVAKAEPLGPDLWVWAAGNATSFAKARADAAAKRNGVLWGVGGVAALASLVVSLAAFRNVRRSEAEGPQEGRRSGPEHVTTQIGMGIKLGRYVLLDRIGEGGMAEIYTAVSFGTGSFRRNFVIKRLRPEMCSNQMAVNQFIDEANLGSKLVHPNIVPVFDFGEVGGDYFLAQEYVIGRDLGRLTRRLLSREQPPLSARAVLYIAHEILGALDYAHGLKDDDGAPLGLVHRDVSPENVIISSRGEVKLLDFGIVKANQGRTTRTDIGLVKGNVDFMAPEQARGRPVDARADLFSVALVMYFALAQEPLYEGETMYDSLVKAAHGPGPTEHERLAMLPDPLPHIMSRALAFDPAARFQTAAEFRAAIAPYMGGGREDVVDAVGRMFDEELQLEQERLSAAFPRPRTRETSVPTAG